MRQARLLPAIAPGMPAGQPEAVQNAMHDAVSAYCALAPVQFVASWLQYVAQSLPAIGMSTPPMSTGPLSVGPPSVPPLSPQPIRPKAPIERERLRRIEVRMSGPRLPGGGRPNAECLSRRADGRLRVLDDDRRRV